MEGRLLCLDELLKDGRIDRAIAVARGVVLKRPDFWMPALFLRLRRGCIWDEAEGEVRGGRGDEHDEDEVRSKPVVNSAWKKVGKYGHAVTFAILKVISTPKRLSFSLIAALLAGLVIYFVKYPYRKVEPYDTMSEKITGMKFVAVPGGCFQMGSPDNEQGRNHNEGPRHEVCVDSFQMGKYEVTQGQWVKIMDSNPSQYQKGDKYPVEKVSWNKIQEFIEKLNEKTGQKYRLPTEGEWEYAARAGTTTARYWGDDISCSRAMYGNSKSNGNDSCMEYTRSEEAPAALTPYSTAPVGKYPKNQFGLYDMLGNVAEFCSNWLGPYPLKKRNPQGPAQGDYRVFRGGSLNDSEREIRSAVRYGLPPHERDGSIGFRLVLPDQRIRKPSEGSSVHSVANTLDTESGNGSQNGVVVSPPPSPPPPIGSDEIVIDHVTGMKFVSVPAGCFQMGSPDNEQERESDEGPVHKVCVDSFQMGKYEVTQGQWQKITGENPVDFKKGDMYPVEKVSWNDAQEFINTLNAKSGKNYRLPTEAEWEYACRANDSGKYCGGDDVDALGWHKKNSGNRSTRPVGGKQANKFGLYDMSGNVWEWCADWSGENYYNSSPQDNPTGPSSGSHRVFRGGTWQHISKIMRAANRGGSAPDTRSDDLGFRLVLPIQ